LKNVGITVTGNGDNSEKKPEKKQIYTDFGELLFTHFGLSGPVILSASAHMPGLGDVEHRVSIDLKPALDLAALDARLLRDFETQKNKNFSNALGALIPSLMIPVLVARSGIDPAKKVNSITRAERRRLAELFKAFDVRVTGARPIDEAVITSGGVDTREIIPATMESKLVCSLFFAGEVINADAYTGGYNLQIAWATAYAAALAAGG
jgi:predicted Rossmann fold flavoprotein